MLSIFLTPRVKQILQLHSNGSVPANIMQEQRNTGIMENFIVTMEELFGNFQLRAGSIMHTIMSHQAKVAMLIPDIFGIMVLQSMAERVI